jgi:hypothetical protein
VLLLPESLVFSVGWGHISGEETQMKNEPTNTESLADQALKLYRPPFRHECGYILDKEGHTVADEVLRVRGWGRISHLCGNPKEMQDAVGDLIAEALTMFWKEKLSK